MVNFVHERSLVRSLIRQVAEIARQNGAARVASIRVQIGEFSGVEPNLFQSAFAEIASETTGWNPALVAELVPLAAQCRFCEKEFAVQDFRFSCPTCGNREVNITKGEELELVSVELEDFL
jgi:hydrogenase nickel incorporation protein HypA/HybF